MGRGASVFSQHPLCQWQRAGLICKCLSSLCSHHLCNVPWAKASHIHGPAQHHCRRGLCWGVDREERFMGDYHYQSPPVDKYASVLNPQRDSSKVCFLQSLGEFPEDLSPVAHSCNPLTPKCSWTFLPSLAHFTHSLTELPETPSPENIPAPSPRSGSVWEKPKQGPWRSRDLES